MNKLRNVFQKTSSVQQQKNKINQDNRRPQQFVKRLSLANSAVPEVGGGGMTTIELPPAINLDDLSEMEKPAYTSWWKDLDPFDLGKINNSTILKFLNGCSLPDTKLEQILALFETAGDGLNRLQFFAMLRLIAHAQNGRKISRALVYLGAPIPRFHTNAIDALIKSPTSATPTSNNSSTSNNTVISPPSAPPLPPLPPIPQQEISTTPKEEYISNNRKSWWGNEKQQQQEEISTNRRSYMGPFTAHTPIPNSPFHNTTLDYFYPLSPTNSNQQQQQIPSWQHRATSFNTPPTTTTTHHNSISINTTRPILTTSLTTTATITPVTPNIIQLQVDKTSQHARSRSAGTASDFLSSISNPYNREEEIEEPLQSSRSSLSLHELNNNTGKSLLLTQKFVYQSPSIRNQELSMSATNPFTPTPKEEMTSPFDDDNVEEDVIVVTPKEEEVFDNSSRNNKPNRYSIPPPAVPSQSTKPAFPKYTRTNSFLMKRSASISVAGSSSSMEKLNHLQRHKSTTGASAMFY